MIIGNWHLHFPSDYKAGFGGQYGVQADRVDKSALGWDHKEESAKHASQTDYSRGFGGKFGVDEKKQDSAAHSYTEQTEAVGTNYEKTRPVGECFDLILKEICKKNHRICE